VKKSQTWRRVRLVITEGSTQIFIIDQIYLGHQLRKASSYLVAFGSQGEIVPHGVWGKMGEPAFEGESSKLNGLHRFVVGRCS